MIRIGHGYDVHASGEGDHVMLGGVRIPSDFSLVAHSDGDVALHALCDALLGNVLLCDVLLCGGVLFCGVLLCDVLFCDVLLFDVLLCDM